MYWARFSESFGQRIRAERPRRHSGRSKEHLAFRSKARVAASGSFALESGSDEAMASRLIVDEAPDDMSVLPLLPLLVLGGCFREAVDSPRNNVPALPTRVVLLPRDLIENETIIDSSEGAARRNGERRE